MIVFVAGPPRTGSMWTYNVTRALLEAAGKTILHHDPLADEIEVAEQAVGDANYMGLDEVYCIKAHLRISPGLPNTKVINNYRDIRDSILSVMRFMKLDDFEKALGIAKSLMADTDYYSDFAQHHGNIIRINYNNMVADPVRAIGSINDFLELGVGKDQWSEIADRFSRHRVQELVKNLDQVSVSSSGEIEGDASENCTSVVNRHGGYRVLDKETLFQTNHISSKAEGEWREVFTPEQQERLLEITSDWLKKYGFEI